MGWVGKNFAKALAIAVFMLVIVAVLLLHECSTQRAASTETRLAKDQAVASLASGADAVDSTGDVEGNAIAADVITKENSDAIQNAQGAMAPVAVSVRDVGIASLCRRAAYRGDSKCLQHSTSQ